MTEAGHDIMVSSRHPERLTGVARTAGTIGQACAFGEIRVAAVPFGALRDIPPTALGGKAVIDGTNCDPERDGAVAESDQRTVTTGEIVERHLAGARVVEAFDAILASDLPVDSRPAVASGRRALPIAGRDGGTEQIVARIQDDLDFDILDSGSLADSWLFERAKPA